MCDNYRAVTLLCTTYKLLESIVGVNIPYAVEIIGEYQRGFRRARSIVDPIFTVRKILEKCWEQNINILRLLIDFQAIYANVRRKAI
jgi:hypothetical protein